MSAPEVLLKSLPGHPTALDQTLGCMTGLFHIFEGHPAFMGRRYSSTGVGIHSGQFQHKTQTESQFHRHERRNNPFSKVEDTHKKAVHSTKQHHRSHSDVSDLAMTPTRTLRDFRTLKDEDGSGQIEPTPAYSKGTEDALGFYNNESLRASALFARDSRRRSDLDQRDYSTRNVVLPKARLVDNHSSSSDIRDAILASFQRETERPKSTKATSDQSLNNSCNQGFLKNRRDACQKDSKGAVSRRSVDLPRSSNVYARSYEPSELVNWKDGLRSSASRRRKLSHHNSPERRVEPKKDRGRSLSRDHYPFASMSPKRFPGSQGPNPQDRRHGEIRNQDFIFKESPGASDFRESLRPFLAGAQERQIVPGQASFTSRSGDSSGFNESNLIEVSHQMFNTEAESCEHSVVPNVIARLMGLEEIPSSKQQGISLSKVPHAKSRGDKFFRGLVQFDPQIMRPTPHTPPPPCQSRKYVAHHLEQPSTYYMKEHRLEGAYQNNYPAQYKLEQGLCSSEEDRDYEHLNSISFLPYEDEKQPGAHPASEQLAKSGKLEDPTNQVEDIISVTSEKKKKIIRKILEAMRPKVLLKISRRKQTEQEKSPVTKFITNDVQPVQELLEKQQQTTLIKIVTGLKLSSGTENEEPPRYTTSDTSSVKQVQMQQTVSSNSSESSIVKPCILQPDENKIVVMKPNTRSQDSNAGIFEVRHVETASSTSAVDKEMVPTRTAQKNNEDWNLAKDLRRAMKPVAPRAAADNAPRSARAKSTLESDYESDPSGTTQNDKSNKVRESRKIGTTPGKRNPSSINRTPELRRQNGRCLSPEARPSSRSSPGKDPVCGTGEVDRKSVAAKAKNDSRAAPTNPKTQLAKEETLRKRVTENPDDSSLCGRSLKNKPTLTKTEKPVSKETFSKRTAGARALSPAAPRKLDVTDSRSSTTETVTLDTSNGSNSAPLQPASGQSQTSGPQPILEHLVTLHPEPGRFKDPHVYMRHTPPDVQKTEGDSVDDHKGDTSEPQNLEACCVIQDEAQEPLQAEEAAIEVSEELTTPRGIPLHCENLDGKLDEGIDRPSPISVLDTITFEEEFTPSPCSPRHSFPVLQESETTYNDEGYESCDKDVEVYHETPSAFIEDDLDFDGLFSKCAERLRVQVENTETKNRLNKFQSYIKDAELDEEKAFVESFLLVPKVATSCRFPESSVTDSCISDKLIQTKPSRFELTDIGNINKNLLESLQSKGILQEDNHLLLLDCLEEIMERILESQSNLMLWAGLPPVTICERTKGKQLEQELWIELRDIKRTASSEDICDTVHRLLQRDLIKYQGLQWSTFNKDREQIGIDMETMIVEDLIEEAARDLSALQWHNSSLPIEATRRQLFTN